MRQRADQERRHGRKGSAHGSARRRVHVTAKEVVHGNVPLARELEPVEAVPPVGVEAAVGEACNFGKSAEDVFEDDEEDKQESDHEGEEQVANGLGEDETAVHVGELRRLEADRGLVEYRDDELFRRDGHEENAAEDGEGLVEEFEGIGALEAWIFELVAECRAEQVVPVVP